MYSPHEFVLNSKCITGVDSGFDGADDVLGDLTCFEASQCDLGMRLLFCAEQIEKGKPENPVVEDIALSDNTFCIACVSGSCQLGLAIGLASSWDWIVCRESRKRDHASKWSRLKG